MVKPQPMNQPRTPLTAVVVDDEPLARAHLRFLLEEQGVSVVDEAEHAAMAIQIAEDRQPDLLFLDIQMPGMTGLQLAEALHHSSANSLIVFVTGFSEYATKAFEHAALDYLVKPVSPARLAKTLARARERSVAAADASQATLEMESSLLATAEPLKRLPIRKDYSVLLVRVEDILCATARDKRVYVRTQDDEEHRTYYTLTQLETMLPSDQFLRVHDSCIANLNSIEELLFLGNHTYAVRLTKGEPLPVGRSRYATLQERLGLGGSTESGSNRRS